MTRVDRLVGVVQLLVGDISRLPGVTLDSAGEQQLTQLIVDAFEVVGRIALDEWEEANTPAVNRVGIAGVGAPGPRNCGHPDCDYEYAHSHG
jgi:hypothetical protein